MTWNELLSYHMFLTSSETQGQIKGARESLNGRENVARRKGKNGEKSSSRRSLLFFVPHLLGRLDFLSSPLSAPGSPRMMFLTDRAEITFCLRR